MMFQHTFSLIPIICFIFYYNNIFNWHSFCLNTMMQKLITSKASHSIFGQLSSLENVPQSIPNMAPYCFPNISSVLNALQERKKKSNLSFPANRFQLGKVSNRKTRITCGIKLKYEMSENSNLAYTGLAKWPCTSPAKPIWLSTHHPFIALLLALNLLSSSSKNEQHTAYVHNSFTRSLPKLMSIESENHPASLLYLIPVSH